MAWVARGKCKALGTKKSSTPAVVPGAAPALAKAGVGGYVLAVSNLTCRPQWDTATKHVPSKPRVRPHSNNTSKQYDILITRG